MAHDIVKFYNKDALEPCINFCHNSDQHDQVIANNVKSLINELTFIQGPPDANVSSLSMNEPH
jgi:endonuclease IV